MTRPHVSVPRVVGILVIGFALMLAVAAPAAPQDDDASRLNDYYADLLHPEAGGFTAMNVNPPFVDVFTGGEAAFEGFGMLAVGGVRFAADMLNPDVYWALETYRIAPGEESPNPPDSGVIPGELGIRLLQADVADAPPAPLGRFAMYAYDRTMSPPSAREAFDGSIFEGVSGLPDGSVEDYFMLVDSLSPEPAGFASDHWFAPGAPLGCGFGTTRSGAEYEVICGPDDPGGGQFGTNWIALGMTLTSALESMGTEAEGLFTIAADGAPIWMGSFGLDLFNYSNQNFTLSVVDDMPIVARWVLDPETNSWGTQATGARFLQGNTVNLTVFIPSSELGPGMHTTRFGTFKAEGPRQSGNVSSATYPAIADPLIPVEQYGLYTYSSDFGLDLTTDATIRDLVAIGQPQEPTPAPATPTPEPTATPEPAPEPAQVAAPTVTSVGGDGLNLGWVAVGAGVLLLFGGAFLAYFNTKGDCEELRKAWVAAQTRADTAETSAAALEGECDGLETEVSDLEDELDSQCEDWPPACRDDYAEEAGDPSTRVTTFDLTVRGEWAAHQWGEYRNGDLSAEEAGRAREDTPPDEFVEQMRQRNERERAARRQNQAALEAKRAEAATKCAEAATARAQADAAAGVAAAAEAKYLECIGKAVEAEAKAAAAATAAAASQEQTQTGGGGTGVSTTPDPPPETGSSCDGEPDVRTQKAQLRKRMLISYEFGIVQRSNRLIGGEERERIASELHEVADGLGTLGTLLSVGSAGTNLYQGSLGAAVGETATGAAGIPTNLAQGVTSLLQNIAAGAAAAADFANAVDAANSLYDVVFKTRSRMVTATVFEVKYCEGGVWKCRTELEIKLGNMMNQNRSKTDWTRREAQREARRANRVLNRMQSESQEIINFIDANQPKAC